MSTLDDEIVIRTRLIPPRLPRRWLRRPRLDQQLAGAVDYPLTVVNASAGYGKSSALASFAARGGWPTIWYSVVDSGDPLVFLLHLVYASRSVVPRVGERALTLLRGEERQSWNQALDALINDLVLMLRDETVLVLDDYHLIDELPEVRSLVERLMLHRPPLLHLVLASRHWPQLAGLPTLRARGELFVVGENELAFNEEEIAELFESVYDRPLTSDETAQLSAQTGGWAIALQLIGQVGGSELRAGNPEQSGLPAESREVLFGYLAQEALSSQPDGVERFLLRSAVLSELQPAVCDALFDEQGSGEILRLLYRRGLFLTQVGPDHYRFHPLFHTFLRARARVLLPEWAELHRRAAEYYQSCGAGEQVLYHLLAVGDTQGAARELLSLAPSWIESSRLVTLLNWIEQLPAVALAAEPALLTLKGDAARLLARFDEALRAYSRAERLYIERSDKIGEASALRGQALVYLDTVQPALAGDALDKAVKLLPRSDQSGRAELIRLIAENRLNRGRATQAVRLYRLADRIDPQSARAHPNPRLLLRLGRLNEALRLLDAAHSQVPINSGRSAEGHRDASVLQALIHCMLGEGNLALRSAHLGLEHARMRGSTLLEAVAHIRIGHALQLLAPADLVAANHHYLQAIAMADTFGVQRTKVEAYMGMALLYGFSGDLTAAQAAVREGLSIVERSGDGWTAALLWTALATAGVVARVDEATSWLEEARRRHQRSRNSYGLTVISLWSALLQLRRGNQQAALHESLATLELAQRFGYDGLLTSTTLFGPRDRMLLVPILISGRADPVQGPRAQELLARGFPAIAADETVQTYHPGSTLRVQLLGRLRVWRGVEEIEPRAWQRKKAQQLLALLLTNRSRWLLREQIFELLWPEQDSSDAEAQFKVTLNALNTALEPARPPRMAPFYIRRQGGAYRFCPPDGVWLDVEAFEQHLEHAQTALNSSSETALITAQSELTEAVSLYSGDYLSEWLYEPWSMEERARLTARYLEAATTLADLLLTRHQVGETIRLCETIISRDSCWEEAYGILMRAYALQGNRRQVIATYERCVRNLRSQLDVAPLPQTTRIYEELRA